MVELICNWNIPALHQLLQDRPPAPGAPPGAAVPPAPPRFEEAGTVSLGELLPMDGEFRAVLPLMFAEMDFNWWLVVCENCELMLIADSWFSNVKVHVDHCSANHKGQSSNNTNDSGRDQRTLRGTGSWYSPSELQLAMIYHQGVVIKLFDSGILIKLEMIFWFN